MSSGGSSDGPPVPAGSGPAERPPLLAELTWAGDLRFTGQSGHASLTLDSHGADGPSPTQALLMAFGGCMGMDIVHILNKSRVPATAVRLSLSGRRPVDHPSRFLAIDLHVDLDGPATDDQVSRAIELSRSTYCSVWHSLREDIALNVTFTVHRPAP
jgi:putative redox protein